MTPEAMQEELQYRIESDAAHFGGLLPERNAFAWRGYLSGLLEWSVIDQRAFTSLSALLPGEGISPDEPHPRQSSGAILQQLRSRIQADLSAADGNLSERRAVFWSAYLAGLYEWSVITSGYRELAEMLPPLKDDPAQAILSGRPPRGGDRW